MWSNEQIDRIGEIITEHLGHEGAFEALSKAMGYDLLESYFRYIVREYEIPIDEYGIDEDSEDDEEF